MKWLNVRRAWRSHCGCIRRCSTGGQLASWGPSGWLDRLEVGFRQRLGIEIVEHRTIGLLSGNPTGWGLVVAGKYAE